jgi:hypothetical protein
MKRLTLLLLVLTALQAYAQQSIDLSGTWQFALDRQGNLRPNAPMSETVALPGTTDTNRKGDPLKWRGETSHLSRLYSYKGRAWYRRTVEIPRDWRGKTIYLTLERTKPSEVYVDGRKAGSANNISTPQVYDLSRLLTPGRHQLAIMVDNANGVPTQLYANSHAYTEDTQTNWNGIIGEICLTTQLTKPTPPAHIHPNFRNFHIEGHHFYANGHRLFLRGKHDACVWPLTGHVPMDVDSWHRYLTICDSYGLNHITSLTNTSCIHNNK